MYMINSVSIDNYVVEKLIQKYYKTQYKEPFCKLVHKLQKSANLNFLITFSYGLDGGYQRIFRFLFLLHGIMIQLHGKKINSQRRSKTKLFTGERRKSYSLCFKLLLCSQKDSRLTYVAYGLHVSFFMCCEFDCLVSLYWFGKTLTNKKKSQQKRILILSSD